MRTGLRSLIVVGSVAFAAAPLATARADSPPGYAAAPRPSPHATRAAASDRGGIVQLVDEALSGITLRPEQTDALEKLGAEDDAKVGAVDKARREYVLALADQIETGKVDESALKDQKKKVEEAAEAASPFLRASFQKMHEILDAGQRKEFVMHFRDALKKRAVSLDPDKQADKWAKTLSLTDDQKAKVRAILEDERAGGETMHARLEKVLDAFPTDSFSIDAVLPAGSIDERTDKMLDRITGVAKKVTEILTPEQCKTAAKAIREKMGRTSARLETEETSEPLETTASTSEAFWAGGAGYYGGAYGGGAAYGFSRSYGAGYGGAYLF
jgi:Spy/CpxP family protein refolding chaperone